MQKQPEIITTCLNSAITAMRPHSGAEVASVSIPFVKANFDYYVSLNGLVFSYTAIHDRHVVRQISTRRLRNKDLVFSANIKGDNTKIVHVCMLMYCAFTLGYYDEGLQLEFIDGDCHHLSLDNLRPVAYRPTAVYLNNLHRLDALYEHYFLYVSRYARWLSQSNVSLDEGKDLASESFLTLCEKPYIKIGRELTLWVDIMRSKLQNYCRKKYRMVSVIDDYGNEWIGERCRHPDMDILSLLPDPKKREYVRLWSECGDNREVCELMGVCKNTADTRVFGALRQLRNELKRDIEIYRAR